MNQASDLDKWDCSTENSVGHACLYIKIRLNVVIFVTKHYRYKETKIKKIMKLMVKLKLCGNCTELGSVILTRPFLDFSFLKMHLKVCNSSITKYMLQKIAFAPPFLGDLGQHMHSIYSSLERPWSTSYWS